jgi:two-component system, sensor histidine kinase
MIGPALPKSERNRLDELTKYNVLDTLPEQVYDDLVFITAQVFATPISLISFVDHDRQWFKSKLGLEVTETSRELSFCGHAILQNDLFIVEDTYLDVRFLDNPLVTDNPNIRFYAGAPIRTPSGENIGTICIIDTVPRKLTSTEKQCLIGLSRQVSSQLELRLSKHEAVSADQAKSLFLANMSHEIRTPMNAISSCTELLIDSIEDQNQLKLLGLMRDAASGLMTVINDVLDFTKIEFESIEIHEDVFNLHSLLNNIVNILNIRAEKDAKIINLHVAKSVPEWIVSDADRLRQILFNLIGNAIKFCSQTVNVSLHVNRSDNETLHCKIKDDGEGISSEDQKRIFDRFAQATNTTVEIQPGTGLGLAISKSLCTAMKGRIWVDSKPGEGAVFFFQIPLKTVNSVDGSVNKKLSSIAPDMGRTLPLNILVAEDDDVNQLLINAMLKKLGYNATLVSNGIEALQACETKHYDVVLMDMNMPIMNGIEATLQIRKSAIVQPTIIALTANAFESDKRIAINAGMDDFLTKPIDLKTVASALRRASNK